MSLFTKQIGSLVGGVSQQPDSIRFDGQSEEQINFYPSLSTGLIKRSPSQFVTQILQDRRDVRYTFPLDRADKQYLGVVFTNGDVSIIDTAGASQVIVNNAQSYLASGSLRHVSIGDSVLLINQSKVVEVDTGVVAPNRPSEALVYVQRGEYGKTYKVILKSTSDIAIAMYTTPDGSQASHSTQVDTAKIAQNLKTQLDSDLASSVDNWDIEVRDNLIHIVNHDDDFLMSTADGFGDTAMYAIKGAVPLFEDLPRKAPEGFVVAVKGSEGNVAGQPYYMQARTSGSAQTGMTGWPYVEWTECVAPGLYTKIKEDTLPVLIQRQADGSFEINHAEFQDRAVGDNDSSPFPSFVGRKINGAFFFKNRLGLFSETHVVLSESGNFFNFWPTATAVLLDADPIDVSLNSKDASDIYHAVPFQNQVMLSTLNRQYSLRSEGNLSLKSIQLTPTTAIETSSKIEPVNSGSSLFLASKNGESTEVKEYMVNNVVDISEAATVTSHVPTYIPWDLVDMKASSDGRHLVLATSKNDLYVYKYLWTGEQKAQSAWFKVQLRLADHEPKPEPLPGMVTDGALDPSNDIYIHGMEFIRGKLYVILSQIQTYGDPVFKVVSFELSDSITEGDKSIRIYLDNQVSVDNAGDDTYDLPYIPEPGLKAVSVDDRTYGEEVDILGIFGSVVTCEPGYSKVLFGYPYPCRYDFSKLYMRGRDQGAIAVTAGNTTILRMLINHANSASVEAEINIKGRAPRYSEFYGRVRGDADNRFGSLALSSGVFNVPINARAQNCQVSLISNNHLPSNITFVDVVMRYATSTGRQI